MPASNDNGMKGPAAEGATRTGRSRRKSSLFYPLFLEWMNVIGAMLARYRLAYRRRRDYEFLPATLEVLERPPAPLSRFMVLFIVVFASFAIGWACWAGMDIVVSASGMVVPSGNVKVVQALEPGLVAGIHVRDGQQVRRGELLISLDGTANREDLQTLEKDLVRTDLTLLRYTAQMYDDTARFQPPPGADEQQVGMYRSLLEQALSAHRQHMQTLTLEVSRCRAEREAIMSEVGRLVESLPFAAELYEKKQTLADKRLVSAAEALEAKIELTSVQHSLTSAKSRLVEVEARLDRARKECDLAGAEYHRDLLDRLTTAKNDREQLFHQIVKARNRQEHFELRAPADGIVQQLAIHTIGGVVTVAQPLLVIVPTDGGFEVEAKVLNKDIGFVAPNQQVSVKVSAFPFTSYGALQGRIEWVAGDAVVDEHLGLVYPVRVSLSGYRLPNTVNGRMGRVTAGMSVAADVKVGRRRVVDYFLGPILRYRDQSLREM